MTMHVIFTDTRIEHEVEYIIFARADEDPWRHGYSCEILMFEPMILASGELVKHPYAYLNAESKCYLQRRSFGHASLDEASERIDHIISSIEWSIHTLGLPVYRLQKKELSNE